MRSQLILTVVCTVVLGNICMAESFTTLNYDVEVACQAKNQEATFENTSSYSWQNAYLMTQLTWLPQLETKIIHQAVKAWQFDHVTIIDKQGGRPRAMLVEQPDYAILAFRGTDDVKEAFTDAKFITKQVHNGVFQGRFHDGFWTIYRQIRAKLIRTLEDRKLQQKPLFVTGHSLGAALAALTVHELYALGYNIRAYYGIAAPRYGNIQAMNMLRRLKFPKYLVSNPKDITPQIPPTLASVKNIQAMAMYWFKFLKMPAHGIIKRMDYAQPPASSIHYMNPGTPTTYSEKEQNNLEQNFWDSFEAEMLGVPKKDWINHIVQLGHEHHPPHKYICIIRNYL